ncbi:NADH-quinone oxidoreductase subunit M [Desulfothermus okinawensis JCM 13304]
MHEFNFPILSVITFFPLVGILFIAFTERKDGYLQKWIAFWTTLINFIISLPLFFAFKNTAQFQFVEKIDWVPSFGISYHVGVDGISLLLVLLTTFLCPICIAACWSDIKDKVKEFLICFLFLEISMIGVFCALDLFLFYIFWELMLIPMFLLILVWGAPARRKYASIKFFLYTMAGSMLMLVGILVLYFYNAKVTGEYTFDLLKLIKLSLPFNYQFWLFLAFGIAFAIKVPMFPFHTWLPDAHTEAPTIGSVILAGVLLKMGTYGFVRFNLTLFPRASVYFMELMAILAIIGIIYGAFMCLVQKDLKRLIAYSSVSHLGFVMLGVFALNMQGLSGGLIQMINHGLSTGALFLLVGMIYERRHTRLIAEFGGLAKPLPMFATLFMIVTLSSIGLPGLNGFIGEFLIMVGAFRAKWWFGVLAATGVILAAWYMLWMYQRVMFGKVTKEENLNLKDLVPREIWLLVPLIVFIVWIGVHPNTFLSKMEPSIKQIVLRYEKIDKKEVDMAGVNILKSIKGERS